MTESWKSSNSYLQLMYKILYNTAHTFEGTNIKVADKPIASSLTQIIAKFNQY